MNSYPEWKPSPEFSENEVYIYSTHIYLFLYNVIYRILEDSLTWSMISKTFKNCLIMNCMLACCLLNALLFDFKLDAFN